MKEDLAGQRGNWAKGQEGKVSRGQLPSRRLAILPYFLAIDSQFKMMEPVADYRVEVDAPSQKLQNYRKPL